MEDTLRDKEGESKVIFVLILVLMEDTLRGNEQFFSYRLHLVLILVLMEDTLRAGGNLNKQRTLLS